MKWVTIILGIIIIAGGFWLLLGPTSADSPTAPTFEEGTATSTDNSDDTTMEGGEKMEDGTIEAGIEVGVSGGTTQEEEEPMGDPIFHALVEYTDNGFTPASVTISQGDTIRFVNNSSRGVWVGGDNHPTHTIYPESSASDCLGTSFDTCRALQAGEFWEFTFNHKGSWGYHNHVRASHGGTVVVQ